MLKKDFEARLASLKLFFTQIILTIQLECENLRQMLSQEETPCFETFKTRHQSKIGCFEAIFYRLHKQNKE